MSKKLKEEVDCFLAEVDAISEETPDLLQSGAPKTDWVVHVDPNTSIPFYYNHVSKISTWEMPEEYKQYLEEYEDFIKDSPHRKKRPEYAINDLEKNGTEKRVSRKSLSPNFIMPHVNARKRRRMKRAWLRSEAPSLEDSVPVEFLSEYIAYSNSSASDSDEACGKKSSLTSGDRSPSPDLSEKDSPSSSVHTSDFKDNPPQFIGPLPDPSIIREHLCSSNSVSSEVKISEPLITTRTLDSSNTSILPSEFNYSVTSVQTYQCSDVNNLKEFSELLLEKMASFDVKLDLIAPLQVLYVQLSTRFEDWSCGHLSSAWFQEKLEEINSYVSEYEEASLPPGWLCSWDRTNKRYAYTCKSTGVSQFQFPNSFDETGSDKTQSQEGVEMEIPLISSVVEGSPKPEPTNGACVALSDSVGDVDDVLVASSSNCDTSGPPETGEPALSVELLLASEELNICSIRPPSEPGEVSDGSDDAEEESDKAGEEEEEEESDDYFYLVEKMLNEVGNV